MSRQIKRVAPNFEWPMSQGWKGYLVPYEDRYSPPSLGTEEDWWQLWEGVSEGSPVSPAFSSPEELATYLAINGDHWYQSYINHPSPFMRSKPEENPSYEGWLSFITGPGWAPSAAFYSDGEGPAQTLNPITQEPLPK